MPAIPSLHDTSRRSINVRFLHGPWPSPRINCCLAINPSHRSAATAEKTPPKSHAPRLCQGMPIRALLQRLQHTRCHAYLLGSLSRWSSAVIAVPLSFFPSFAQLAWPSVPCLPVRRAIMSSMAGHCRGGENVDRDCPILRLAAPLPKFT